MVKRFDSQLISYLFNSLSPQEHQMIEQQLHTDPQLHQELAELREIMGLIAYGESTQSAPSGLRSRILQAAMAEQSAAPINASMNAPIHRPIETERHVGRYDQAVVSEAVSAKELVPAQGRSPLWAVGGLRGKPGVMPRSAWIQSGAIAASLLLCVGLGVNNYLLRQQLVGATSTMKRGTEFLTLVEANATQAPIESTVESNVESNVSGKVVLDELAGKVLVVITGLSPSPTHETYYLSAVLENSTIFCGEIIIEEAETTVVELNIDPQLYDSELVKMLVVRGQRENLPATTRIPTPKAEDIVLTTALG